MLVPFATTPEAIKTAAEWSHTQKADHKLSRVNAAKMGGWGGEPNFQIEEVDCQTVWTGNKAGLQFKWAQLHSGIG